MTISNDIDDLMADLPDIVDEEGEAYENIDEFDNETKQSVVAFLMWHSGAVLRNSIGESEARASIIDSQGEEALANMCEMGIDHEAPHRTQAVSSILRQVRATDIINRRMPICYLDVEALLSGLIIPITNDNDYDLSVPEAITVLPFDSWQHFREKYNELGNHLLRNPNTVLHFFDKYQVEFLRIADYRLESEMEIYSIKPEWHIVNPPCHSDRSFNEVSHVNDVGKLISVRGQVIEVGETKAVLTSVAFRCITKNEESGKPCSSINLVTQNPEENRLIKPNSCGTCGGKQFVRCDSNESKMESMQRIVIQEESVNEEARALKIEMRGRLINSVAPGSTVEVVGYLRLEQVTLNSTICTQYMLAKSVKEISTLSASLDIRESDREEIEIFHQSYDLEDRMQILCDAWIGHIHCDERIKRALLLMNCRAPKNEKFGNRGSIHILLVGDPGTAKTKLLESTAKLHPGSRYVSADNATQAGLTGACAQVEDMYTQKKRWAVIPGELGLTSPTGVCAIDEYNLYKSDFGDLNTAMESGEIVISKVVKARIPTECSVLAGCNPNEGDRKKFSKGDGQKPYWMQIGLAFPQLQRFDGIWTFEDVPDAERDELIAMAMLSGITESDDVTSEDEPIDIEFVQKYIAVSREGSPRLTKEAGRYIAKVHRDKRSKSGGEDNLRSHRQVASLARFTLAVARFDMSDIATLDHVKFAEHVLSNSLQEKDPGAVDGGLTIEARASRLAVAKAFVGYANALVEKSELFDHIRADDLCVGIMEIDPSLDNNKDVINIVNSFVGSDTGVYKERDGSYSYNGSLKPAYTTW